MTSISAYQTSLNGIQSGLAGVNKAAEEIAGFNGDTAQLTKALVSMDAQAKQVEASVKVLETSSDMVGTILDIKV